MTERKVLNKYFPPDYDPSKIPRLRRGDGRRQFNIRTMAPFNMRCNTCNGYIYKAKKFNSRMETAENVDYLGLRHYRFFIRCPSCCAEIIWRTDIESGDYVLEAGAKRNFEALKTAEELEAKRQAEEEEELANNPMKLLEKRTDQSKQEMDMVEVIEDLRQLNQRQAGMEADHVLLRRLWKEQEDLRNAEKEEDEALLKELLESQNKAKNPIDLNDLEVVEISPSIPEKKLTNKLKPACLQPMSNKSQTCSYMKRQFQGVLLVKKDGPASPSFLGKRDNLSDNPEFNNSTIATGSLAPKQAKLSPEKTSETSVAGLPGITYSDHSDSD